MEIILKKDVANLGHADDVVKVKAGYALNYLVPQGFAIVATPSALKQHAETIRQRAHKEAAKVAAAQELAAKISSVLVKVSAKVSENGKIYGSVTNDQIAAAMREQLGIDVDKRKIEVEEPIKNAGQAFFNYKLMAGISTRMIVNVKVVAK